MIVQKSSSDEAARRLRLGGTVFVSLLALIGFGVTGWILPVFVKVFTNLSVEPEDFAQPVIARTFVFSPLPIKVAIAAVIVVFTILKDRFLPPRIGTVINAVLFLALLTLFAWIWGTVLLEFHQATSHIE